jgi:hypothetical protein
VCFNIVFGLKVFMDAYMPVTHEERDRYPLGPPSYGELVEWLIQWIANPSFRNGCIGSIPILSAI